MTTRGARALSARADESIHQRVEAAAAKSGVDKATWIREAVLFVLEQEEKFEQKGVGYQARHIASSTFVKPQGRMFPRR